MSERTLFESNGHAPPAIPVTAEVADRTVWLPHSVVHTPDDNREITLESVADLLDSMAEKGQRVPGIAFPHPAKPGDWMCAEGNRRLYCCRILNKPFWAVTLDRPVSETELIEIRLDTNTIREAMDNAEVGADIFAWIERTGKPQDQAASRFKKSASYVSKLLAPYKAGCPELLAALKARQIVLTAAPAVASLPHDQQREILPLCLGQKRMVIENLVRERKGKKPKKQKQMKLPLGNGVELTYRQDTSVDAIQAAIDKIPPVLKKLAKDYGGKVALLPGLLT